MPFIVSFMLCVLVAVMSDSAIPWTVTCQAPLSMGLSGQEYWSGLPFPSPEALPYPGIKPGSPTLQADSLLTELPVERPQLVLCRNLVWRAQENKDLKIVLPQQTEIYDKFKDKIMCS